MIIAVLFALCAHEAESVIVIIRRVVDEPRGCIVVVGERGDGFGMGGRGEMIVVVAAFFANAVVAGVAFEVVAVGVGAVVGGLGFGFAGDPL